MSTQPTRRADADDERKRFDVVGHDGASTHHAAPAQPYTADDRGVHADADIVLDDGRHHRPLVVGCGTGRSRW